MIKEYKPKDLTIHQLMHTVDIARRNKSPVPFCSIVDVRKTHKRVTVFFILLMLAGYITYMNTGSRRALAEVEEYYERVHGIIVEARLENGEIEIYR